MSDAGPAVDAAPETLAPVDPLPPAIDQESFSDATEAARYLASLRSKKDQPAESAKETATAEPEPAEQAAADPETDPGEMTEANEPDQPAIDPPRSWTKEAKDRWNALPRDTQEYLAQRESERDKGLLRSQNEAAEQRKALEAERQAVEQLKQQYESKLPNLTKTLEQALQNDFGDIKDLNDVRQMQMNDPFRFQQWQLRQMELAAAQKEQADADARRATEAQSKWNEHTQAEDKRFTEALSDKDRGNLKALMEEAPNFLEDRGFSQKELADLWNGQQKPSFRDHRLQLLILDAMKYRDLQRAPAKAVPKTVPPVQRPGAAQPRGSSAAGNIQALNNRLNESGNLDDAFALWQARRSSKG